MINTIKQALTTREIRRKLELMVFVIFITRVISMIPVPGIDASVFKQWMAVNSNDALNLFSAFTGGSFENFSMFALGITPLITAQIVVQLLGSVIPSLGKLQKKGEHGQKVTKKITNIVGIVLAIVQSCCMAIGFNMIKESREEEEEEEKPYAGVNFKELLILAVATSIDALAVGVTFAFLQVNIVPAITIIGCTTFVISIAGVYVGNVFGSRYKSRAELTGGIILILIGLKILLEHVGVIAF